MSSDSRAGILYTHAGGISMRLLKYIPSASAAILIATVSASSALAQSMLTTPTVTLSGGGVIDFGSTGYFQIRVTVPAGTGDAHNVMLNGVFTPGNSSPTAKLSGFGSGANGTGCVHPDPNNMSNPNSFQCALGNIIAGTAVTAASVQRRVVISQGAPATRPTSCPPTEHAGDLTVTASAMNAPSIMVMKVGHDTEDFADLDVQISGIPDKANSGDTLKTQVTITNFGPCPVEHVCASQANGSALLFVSNTGDCTKPYGACNLGGSPSLPAYDPTKECGFPQAVNPDDQVPGFLLPGAKFVFTSTYTVDQLPGSVTNAALPQEVDIQADTNLISYGSHQQAAVAQSLWENSNSCNVAATGGSSLALLGLVLVAARALNRRRRS